MFDRIVLDGELNLQNRLDGGLDLNIPELAEAGIVIKVNEGVLPAYTGIIEVIPSDTIQTLETQETSVLDNIVIQPIPSNYGKITWNGSILTVS